MFGKALDDLIQFNLCQLPFAKVEFFSIVIKGGCRNGATPYRIKAVDPVLGSVSSVPNPGSYFSFDDKGFRNELTRELKSRLTKDDLEGRSGWRSGTEPSTAIPPPRVYPGRHEIQDHQTVRKYHAIAVPSRQDIRWITRALTEPVLESIGLTTSKSRNRMYYKNNILVAGLFRPFYFKPLKTESWEEGDKRSP